MGTPIDFGLKTPKAIVKMDALQGCLKVRNSASEDVTFEIGRFVMHLSNLEVGWALFQPGEGVVLRGTASDDPPGPDWKLAVRVQVDGRDNVPEFDGPIGPGEICSTAYVVRCAFQELYEKQFDPVADDHPGELPTVEISGWRTVSMKNGTAHQPIMEIVDWADDKNEAAELGDPVTLLS